jgi:hypothetical protein
LSQSASPITSIFWVIKGKNTWSTSHQRLVLVSKEVWARVIVWVSAELSAFCIEQRFYLKERQGKCGYSDIFTDICSTGNEMSLSLHIKQLAILVFNDKIWAFKQKLESWNTCIHPCELDKLLSI